MKNGDPSLNTLNIAAAQSTSNIDATSIITTGEVNAPD